MEVKGKRNSVCSVPLRTWAPWPYGARTVSLSPRFRNFQPRRSRPYVRLTTTGGPRRRLLWSTEVGDQVVVAFASYELDRWNGSVELLRGTVIERYCALPED